MSEVHGRIEAALQNFHKQKDLEALKQALALAQTIRPESASGVEERRELRRSRFGELLTILAAIDAETDPSFNPKDVPSSTVAPPLSGGVILDSGIDPKHVKDPRARAEYERAIAANAQKAKRYEFQTGLRRINEDASAEVEKAFHDPYAATERGQQEMKAAIERLIENPARKASLLENLEKVRG
jgi:hypothetical protein